MTAWENCLAAAQRYGSYVAAIGKGGISADIAAAQSGGMNLTVGEAGNWDGSASNKAMVQAIIAEMQRLSGQWSRSNSKATNDDLHRQAAEKAAMLAQYGVEVSYDSATGIWKIIKDLLNPSNIGKNLYYAVYHRGGIAGGGTAKENEIMAKLQKGEPVISNQAKGIMFEALEFISLLRKKIEPQSAGMAGAGVGALKSPITAAAALAPNINFGDVIVYGADDSAVEQIRQIKRDQANEVLRYLGIRK